jgi:NAD(P)H-hydrate repair Nnr-like enzyme with NAD(P)H-hydrate epimerase domain
MQVAAIALVAVSLMSAGAAVAAEHVSDMDYLKASRCSGIATGMSGADAPTLAAFVKQQGRQRDEIILARSQSEFDRAKRQARAGDNKDRLTAELSGACLAYSNTEKTTAAVPAGTVATR